MWADRLCHTRPENSGDEALARRLLGRGGPRLRANLRHDLRYAYGTSLRPLRRRHPIHEFLAVPEPKRSNVCASTREPARAGGPEALPRSGRRRRKPRPVSGRGRAPRGRRTPCPNGPCGRRPPRPHLAGAAVVLLRSLIKGRARKTHPRCSTFGHIAQVSRATAARSRSACHLSCVRARDLRDVRASRLPNV